MLKNKQKELKEVFEKLYSEVVGEYLVLDSIGKNHKRVLYESLLEARQKGIDKLWSFILQHDKAYGGCELCYGKGYSTEATTSGSVVHYCFCGRGKQLQDWFTKHDKALIEKINIMKKYLFLTDEQPDKGEVFVKLDDILSTLK